MANYLGTGVLLIDYDGNAIINRKDNKPDDKGVVYKYHDWCCLFGGEIEQHELNAPRLKLPQKCRQAAMRELYQEILSPDILASIDRRLLVLDLFRDLPAEPWDGVCDTLPFMALGDREEFAEWKAHFFTDNGTFREDSMAPHEGYAMFVKGEDWPRVLSEEKFLSSTGRIIAWILRRHFSNLAPLIPDPRISPEVICSR